MNMIDAGDLHKELGALEKRPFRPFVLRIGV